MRYAFARQGCSADKFRGNFHRQDFVMEFRRTRLFGSRLGRTSFGFGDSSLTVFEFCRTSFTCSRVMASPVFVGALTLEDVLELSADELRYELAGRYIDPKGLSKVEMQKALIKALSPVLPVVTQPASPRTALSPQQQMELEVMRMKLEQETLEKKARIEAEERKELHEREQRREEQEPQALEKKEAIERQERAEALEKKERQDAIEKQERQEALGKKER